MQNQPESIHSSHIRTFLVFLDLPIHYEFRATDLPLLPEGTVIEFNLTLKDPRSRKSREVLGPYKVVKRKLVYNTVKASSSGFSQYLELSRND